MKQITFFFSISILTFLSCNNFCARSPVGYFDLANELNKIYTCNQKHVACNSNVVLSEYDVITISEGTIYNGDNQNAVISVAEQDQLINAAEQLANQNKPTCESGQPKFVTDIQFINDILVCTGCTHPYKTYIVVTYACCSGRLPS